MNQLDPNFFQNVLNCINDKDLVQAEDLLLWALNTNPKDADVLRLLSVVAALKFDFRAALDLIDQVLVLTPQNGVAYSNKGNILKELGQYEEALKNYDIAIQLMPGYAETYNNKANALQDLHRYEESIIWYDKAIAINPQYVEAFCNKGNALEWLGRHQEAMSYFDRATALNPQYVDAYWQKGLSQLASGNFELGWQNYEARWTKSNPVKFEYLEIPRLRGTEGIAGKKILIWAEQGLGDTIQFCRYIELLCRLGAKITFLVPDALLNILSPIQKFCDLRSNLVFQVNEFDFQSPLLSLPLLFGTTLDSVPCDIPYLNAEEEKRKILQSQILPSSNIKVGVIWSGGFRLLYSDGYLAGYRRNIELDLIAKLQEIQGVDFYSLQKGDPAESELKSRKDELWPGIINCSYLIKDFSDTAALIECMDLIISVDTSTAHLAGALGKPVWILNRYDSCWRWLRGRTDSPWYPTAKIYHQKQPGNWDEVIERVKIDLSEYAQRKTTAP
ncbi:tetratricopeptide repeat protein [Polynucleobacter sp. MWH-Braz-FAM2G]|uniref:tetratricopeptide repeat protein n=1 Tax=Polynucleobacter sp. MWH-Braz-FAM2G TaxID=1855883 RepID=UPI001BFD001A|nr:tetratricopeptide repeat protein [Polynucleobacter sp. MWH-Braz-FAM2G]QWD90900.1 tetratricopeptide repeat protein [Polynucleobacter sp. MWH-Braz-FAM2G]